MEVNHKREKEWYQTTDIKNRYILMKLQMEGDEKKYR